MFTCRNIRRIILWGALLLIGFWCAHAFAQYDSESAFSKWAEKQDVMPTAWARMNCATDASLYPPEGNNRCPCCNGAEVVKSQFRVLPGGKYGKDTWYWLNIRTGQWDEIPDDIIHPADEPTPDGRPVAFEYPIGSGKLRCFFIGNTEG